MVTVTTFRQFTTLKCFQKAYALLILLTFIVCIFEIISHHGPIKDNKCPPNPEPPEKIDVVYTWVNRSDPRFQQTLRPYLNYTNNQPYPSDKDGLKYSLRSLERYAPWVNHVYIVTNGQIPHWLDLDYPKVTVVTHDQIFDHPEQLPTFSSPAIEMNLHKIPNLTRRFVYFNDDLFLRSPVFPEDFYSVNRGFLIYLGSSVPPCSRDCSWILVGDGHCDPSCHNVDCQMDGGDCDLTLDPLSDLAVDPGDSVRVLLASAARALRADSNSSRNDVMNIVREYNRKLVKRNKLLSMTRRKTTKLDTTHNRASVQHTNRVLNDKYGYSIRRLPQQVPRMIDKVIMAQLQKKFAREVRTTTHNHLRSPNDLHLTFAYYYFVTSERLSPSIFLLFHLVDSDHSGDWSETELRTLATKLYDLPLTHTDLVQLVSLVHNCSAHFDTSRSVICECPPMIRLLEHNAAKIMDVHRFRFEVIPNSDYVVYKRLSSNHLLVEQQLDQVRRDSRAKFVRLDDNLMDVEDSGVVAILRGFYQSLFGRRSRFELRGNNRNRYLYVEDYDKATRARAGSYLVVCCFLLLVPCSLLLVLLYFKCKVKT